DPRRYWRLAAQQPQPQQNLKLDQPDLKARMRKDANRPNRRGAETVEFQPGRRKQQAAQRLADNQMQQATIHGCGFMLQSRFSVAHRRFSLSPCRRPLSRSLHIISLVTSHFFAASASWAGLLRRGRRSSPRTVLLRLRPAKSPSHFAAGQPLPDEGHIPAVAVPCHDLERDKEIVAPTVFDPFKVDVARNHFGVPAPPLLVVEIDVFGENQPFEINSPEVRY